MFIFHEVSMYSMDSFYEGMSSPLPNHRQVTHRWRWRVMYVEYPGLHAGYSGIGCNSMQAVYEVFKAARSALRLPYFR